MSFTPSYPNSLFTKPLLNQVIAIIQRDQAAAIALVNPTLEPIAEFHKGPGTRTAFPWLTVGLVHDSFDREAQTFTRRQVTRLNLSLDVGQFDNELAQDNAADYARVLDMVIASAGPEPTLVDWMAALPIYHETVPTGITTPNAAGTVKDVFVEDHQYSVVNRDQLEKPVMNVTLTVLFELEED